MIVPDMQVLTPARSRALPVLLLGVLSAAPAFAGVAASTSPWETMASNMADAFTGPLARSLSLIAIVVTGMMFAYGEPGGKRALAGVGFGLAMAIGAAQWLTWLTT